MHRRQFLSLIATGLVTPRAASAQQTATPAATPQHSGRPRPIVLGEGIELIDYRIYPSTDVRRIIGEIWNTRDEMVDAPVMSMSFPGVEEQDGFAYAPPVLPVLRPGESTMIFGVLPAEIDSDERLASGEFGLCSPVGAGEYTDRYISLELSIMRDSVVFEDEYLDIRGRIANTSGQRAMFTSVRGLVRDHNGRYAGCTTTAQPGHVVSNGTRDFRIEAGGTINLIADPFRLLGTGTNYTVDIIPGLIGPLTAPGCTAGYPWD